MKKDRVPWLERNIKRVKDLHSGAAVKALTIPAVDDELIRKVVQGELPEEVFLRECMRVARRRKGE